MSIMYWQVIDGQLVPIPINQNTINKLYGLNLSCEQMQDFYKKRSEKKDIIKTSEDVVVNAVGRELYEKIFKGYTNKQWDLDPSELDADFTTKKDTANFTAEVAHLHLDGFITFIQKSNQTLFIK